MPCRYPDCNCVKDEHCEWFKPPTQPVPQRRFTGAGELERAGYIPAGSAAEREGNAGVAGVPRGE